MKERVLKGIRYLFTLRKENEAIKGRITTE